MNVMQSLLKRYRRKVNKVIKGGSILSILFSLMISLIIPPFNIYADTLSMSNIVGINYTVSNSMVVGTVTYNNMTYNRYSTDYDVEIKLDDSYLGWCQLTIEYDYYDRDSSGVVSKNTNVTRRIYINGDTAHININILNNYGSQPLIILQSNPRVTTITNSNVVPYGDLATLEDILSVLNDIYTNTSVDLYGELQNIVSNTSISNQYLEALTKIKQFDIPFESLSCVYVPLQYYPIKEFYNNSYYDFPILSMPSNGLVIRQYLNDSKTYCYIFACNKNVYDINTFNNAFSYSGINIQSIKTLYSISSGYNVTKLLFTVNTSGNYDIRCINSMEYIPIYFNDLSNKCISTDFALQFELSNNLLYNLNIIASGTNQSNISSNNLETQKGTFDTTSNNLYNSENAFNSDMNTKLQSIDTSFNPSTSFGSKFLSSANWVRTQFDNITSTTPFGTVLSFSMLLGLSLLIIGKVFK